MDRLKRYKAVDLFSGGLTVGADANLCRSEDVEKLEEENAKLKAEVATLEGKLAQFKLNCDCSHTIVK